MLDGPAVGLIPGWTSEPHHLVLHVLIMFNSLVGAWQIRELGNPGEIYRQCMGMMARLAELGLVHCDFNEFNLLVSDSHSHQCKQTHCIQARYSISPCVSELFLGLSISTLDTAFKPCSISPRTTAWLHGDTMDHSCKVSQLVNNL